ncbi:MAG TPA: hypothetical protein PLU49_04095 [Saprospiraceae bacterium]|nr:hypothetical protein [Saprospiraceae bacterium]
MTYDPTKHHRRSIRLKGYDYSRAGLYFITICTQNRACLFGEIKNGEMILNQYGQIAANEWMKTTEIRSNVELGELIIMPNHIHGIIRLLGRGELHSPDNKLGVCNTPQRSPDNKIGEFHSPQRTIGAIVRGYKSAVTRKIGSLRFKEKLWQSNYYEHIIRNERAYFIISEYIRNNPANWDKKPLKQ